MGNIGDRIKQIIEASHITQTEFAQNLCITPGMVSKMCSGSSIPSDRTIFNICREFDVNEIWLRTGIGEMFRTRTPDERIVAFCAGMLARDNESLHKQFLITLLESTEEELQVIKKLAVRLLDSEKTE